ncbi:invasion associated locus B family protein [Siculibacillus lacustris]|uniref:invasion associated locus B family protein n=1 Tax=Siculibacillus lacustris TaxID=1549641 RepID=UPI0013F17043|nr:invasion associated locus B family protein [Siculibacillus lacustris]
MTVSTNSAGFARSCLTALAFVGAIALSTATAPAQTEDTPPPAAAPAAPKPVVPKPAATPVAPKPATPAAPKPATPAAPAPAATAPKPAAAAPAAPTAPVATADDPAPWIKICSRDADKKNVCLVAKEFRSPEGQLIASVAMRDVEGDPKKVLLIAVPPVVLIQPGMRVAVDKGKADEAKYTICFSNACYGELNLGDQMGADMKKGQNLVVTALNIQQKPMQFAFPLTSFKQASEGPGLDPTADQQNQEQLQQQLQKRAEEAAKKLSGDAPKP